jgi:hypothetical protein
MPTCSIERPAFLLGRNMWKSKLSVALAALGFGLTLSVATAKADTITTFDVSATFVATSSGSFTGCSGCTLGGNIVIDVTNGTIQSADITMTGQPVGPFTSNFGSGSTGSQFSEDFQDASLANHVYMWLPVSSLLGYSGGIICGSVSNTGCSSILSAVDSYTVNPSGVTWEISSGSLTPAAATPIPAALPLFASGLGAMGLLGWRRKRKAQLAA